MGRFTLRFKKISSKEDKEVFGPITVKQMLSCICQSCTYASEVMLTENVSFLEGWLEHFGAPFRPEGQAFPNTKR